MCACGCGGHKGWKKVVLFLSRVFLALLFVVVGWSKLTNFSGTAGYIGSAGLPMPEVLTVLAIIFEFVGGVALLLGFHARIAAWMLAIFTIIATALFHTNLADPLQLLALLKNTAILGGLLQVAMYGAGAWKIPYPKCPGKMCPDCSADCSCCEGCGCDGCNVGKKDTASAAM